MSNLQDLVTGILEINQPDGQAEHVALGMSRASNLLKYLMVAEPAEDFVLGARRLAALYGRIVASVQGRSQDSSRFSSRTVRQLKQHLREQTFVNARIQDGEVRARTPLFELKIKERIEAERLKAQPRTLKSFMKYDGHFENCAPVKESAPPACVVWHIDVEKLLNDVRGISREEVLWSFVGALEARLQDAVADECVHNPNVSSELQASHYGFKRITFTLTFGPQLMNRLDPETWEFRELMGSIGDLILALSPIVVERIVIRGAGNLNEQMWRLLDNISPCTKGSPHVRHSPWKILGDTRVVFEGQCSRLLKIPGRVKFSDLFQPTRKEPSQPKLTEPRRPAPRRYHEYVTKKILQSPTRLGPSFSKIWKLAEEQVTWGIDSREVRKVWEQSQHVIDRSCEAKVAVPKATLKPKVRGGFETRMAVPTARIKDRVNSDEASSTQSERGASPWKRGFRPSFEASDETVVPMWKPRKACYGQSEESVVPVCRQKQALKEPSEDRLVPVCRPNRSEESVRVPTPGFRRDWERSDATWHNRSAASLRGNFKWGGGFEQSDESEGSISPQYRRSPEQSGENGEAAYVPVPFFDRSLARSDEIAIQQSNRITMPSCKWRGFERSGESVLPTCMRGLGFEESSEEYERDVPPCVPTAGFHRDWERSDEIVVQGLVVPSLKRGGCEAGDESSLPVYPQQRMFHQDCDWSDETVLPYRELDRSLYCDQSGPKFRGEHTCDQSAEGFEYRSFNEVDPFLLFEACERKRSSDNLPTNCCRRAAALIEVDR